MNNVKVDNKDFIDLIYVDHPEDRIIKYQKHGYCIRLLESFDAFGNTIILKCRQIGITTLFAVHAYNKMLNNDKISIGYLSPCFENGHNFIKKIKLMNYRMVGDLKLDIETDNKRLLEFDNGSYVECISSETDLVSRSYDIVLGDEIAFIDDISSIHSELPYRSQQIIYASSRNSMNDKLDKWFMDKFKDSLRMKNDFRSVLLDMEMNPFMDEDDEEKLKTILGDKQYEYEYNCGL